MPYGQTWVLASIGAVVEMGILNTLKRLHMASRRRGAIRERDEGTAPYIFK
jgi:hypothetical protein